MLDVIWGFKKLLFTRKSSTKNGSILSRTIFNFLNKIYRCEICQKFLDSIWSTLISVLSVVNSNSKWQQEKKATTQLCQSGIANTHYNAVYDEIRKEKKTPSRGDNIKLLNKQISLTDLLFLYSQTRCQVTIPVVTNGLSEQNNVKIWVPNNNTQTTSMFTSIAFQSRRVRNDRVLHQNKFLQYQRKNNHLSAHKFDQFWSHLN